VRTQDYIQIATDPDAWLRKSCELRRSADLLWDQCFKVLGQLAAVGRGESRPVTEEWEIIEGYMMGAQLMYALALETAFKARILRDHIDGVTLEILRDKDGTPTGAEITRLGVPLRQGHDLVTLAEAAGVFQRRDAPLFRADSDYVALREILRYLAQVTRWSGRYPVPRKSGDHYRKPENLPGRALNHFMRDWLDRVLDSYHARAVSPTQNG
jgi:hypothetical protein